MSLLRSFGKTLIRLLPADSPLLYRFARAVANRHNGDNNCDMANNGEARFLTEAVPRARVVFDVGANVGGWTAETVKVNPAAVYHCFEPSPTTFRALSARALPDNVTLNNVGLSDRVGDSTLFVAADCCGANSLHDRAFSGNGHALRQETVRLETLDAYCRAREVRQVDFLKLDVEGHEFAVLRGAGEMLARGHIGVIQFEYGGTYLDARVLLKDVWDYVRSVNPGYAFYKIFPCELRRVNEYRQVFETFQYSNWVILSKEWQNAGLTIRDMTII